MEHCIGIFTSFDFIFLDCEENSTWKQIVNHHSETMIMTDTKLVMELFIFCFKCKSRCKPFSLKNKSSLWYLLKIKFIDTMFWNNGLNRLKVFTDKYLEGNTVETSLFCISISIN